MWGKEVGESVEVGGEAGGGGGYGWGVGGTDLLWKRVQSDCTVG